LFSASNSPTNNTASPYITPNTDLIGPGSYTVDVTNFVTSCVSTGTIVLQKNEATLLIVNASKTDQEICDFDGSISIGDVLINGVLDPNHSNFDFTWFESDPNGVPVINLGNGVDTLTVNNYASIQAGSYYVKAVRTVGLSGSGCESAPLRVNIDDVHVNPIPQIQAFANSTCSGAFLNGAIVINVSESQGPGVGEFYTYENFTDGAVPPVTFVNNNGNGINDGVPLDTDSIQNLAQATYTFRVVNQVTFCPTPASIEVKYDPVASKPNIVTVIGNLPVDCLGTGGSAEVTSITIGDNTPIDDPAGLSPPNFEYFWYDNEADASIDPPAPGNFPTIDRILAPLPAGIYFVKVKDLLTECISTPIEVPIDGDDVVYPDLAVRQSALLLSCDVTIGTASLSASADGIDESNDVGNDYIFDWYPNLNGSLPLYAADTDSIGDLISGSYSVTVTRTSTGCSTTEFFIIPPLDPKFLPKMSLSGAELSSCRSDNGSIAVKILPFTQDDNGLKYEDSFTSYDFDVDLYNGNQLGGGINVEPALLPADKNNIPSTVPPTAPGSFISDTLAIGIYTIRVLDRNTGCIIVDTTSVIDDRRNPVPVVIMENPLTNCDIHINGQLSVSADGNPDSYYDFRWWSAANPPPVGDTLSYGDKLIGVDQGDYFVLVVNKASGCDSLATGTVTPNQVFPPAPNIKLIRDQNICWWTDAAINQGGVFPSGWLQGSVGADSLTVGYQLDWYIGSFDNGNINSQLIDTTGVNYIHLQGDSTYSLKATILSTGCYSVAAKEVPLNVVYPNGLVTTTPSYCSDAFPNDPSFRGSGSVQLTLTNEGNVFLRDAQWFDESDFNVGSGTQVFELLPGVYEAQFISNEFCSGTASGEVLTEIRAYNLVSPDGAGNGTIGASNNDFWIIDCISEYPNNNVKVFNRYGILVFEKDGYNNDPLTSFRGIGVNGVYSMGNELPDGTYFYIIDKRSGTKPITGFLELAR